MAASLSQEELQVARNFLQGLPQQQPSSPPTSKATSQFTSDELEVARNFLQADFQPQPQSLVFPVANFTANNAPVSSPFGPRRAPTQGASTNHNGVDLAIPSGTPVLASFDGKVSRVFSQSGGGNVVEIEGSVNGQPTKQQFLHLGRQDVKPGQQVKAGQALGLSGNTGISTGPHLDTRIIVNGKHVDPIQFFKNTPSSLSQTPVISSKQAGVQTKLPQPASLNLGLFDFSLSPEEQLALFDSEFQEIAPVVQQAPDLTDRINAIRNTPEPQFNIQPLQPVERQPQSEEILQTLGNTLEGITQARARRDQEIAESNKPSTNFFGDFANEAINAASLDTLDLPSGGGIGSGLGRFAGSGLDILGGALAGGPVGAIATAGALGGGRAIDRQMDAGVPLEEINPLPVLVEGGGEALLTAVPFARGGSLLSTIGKNAVINAAGEAVLSPALQQIETGSIDPQRTLMDIASAAGIGAAAGGVFGRTRLPSDAPDFIQRTAQGLETTATEIPSPTRLQRQSELIDLGGQRSGEQLTEAGASTREPFIPEEGGLVDVTGRPLNQELVTPERQRAEDVTPFREGEALSEEVSELRLGKSESPKATDVAIERGPALPEGELVDIAPRLEEPRPEILGPRGEVLPPRDTPLRTAEEAAALRRFERDADTGASRLPDARLLDETIEIAPRRLTSDVDIVTPRDIRAQSLTGEALDLPRTNRGLQVLGRTGEPLQRPVVPDQTQASPRVDVDTSTSIQKMGEAEVFTGQRTPELQAELSREVVSDVKSRGEQLVSMAEALEFAQRTMPDQVGKLQTIIEGGKTRQRLKIFNNAIEDLGRGDADKIATGDRVIDPIGVSIGQISTNRFVQNLRRELGSDQAVIQHLTRELTQRGVRVPDDIPGLRKKDGTFKSSKLQKAPLANKLREIDPDSFTTIRVYAENFGESSLGDTNQRTRGYRLDRIQEASLTGESELVTDTRRQYDNEIAPSFDAIDKVLQNETTPKNLKRAIKQLEAGRVNKNSIRTLTKSLREMSTQELVDFCRSLT